MEDVMFYEVRVFNPDGSVKKVVSRDELKQVHWDNFRKQEENMSLQNSERPRVPQWVKDTLDAEFIEFYDSNTPEA